MCSRCEAEAMDGISSEQDLERLRQAMKNVQALVVMYHSSFSDDDSRYIAVVLQNMFLIDTLINMNLQMGNVDVIESLKNQLKVNVVAVYFLYVANGGEVEDTRTNTQGYL